MSDDRRSSMPAVAAQAFGLFKEGVFQVDTDFRLVFVSEYAARLAGFPNPESMVAAGLRTVDMYVDQNDHERVLERLQRDGEVDNYVCQLKDLSGRAYWIELAVRTREDDDGRCIGYWGVFRDLTPRMEAEQARDQLHAELITALQRLETRNRDLREFSAAVTHDLRSPLVALKGFAEILRDKHSEDLSQEAVHMLDRIHHNALQMDSIIRGIQDLVIMESCREQRRWMALGEVFSQVMEQRRADMEGLDLEVSIGESFPRLRVHPTRLFQLLDNLFSNALRALAGRKTSRIWLGFGEPCAQGVFFLEDDGPGLEPENRKKVFEAFFRADSSRPGAGIGLTIAGRIVGSYGGRIWAEEGRTGGARFCFSLGSDCLESAQEA